jgi:hypothetical protein
MEFHLPKVPHSWRELGKEIAIITVGILIALFLEAIVDDWRWRQKVAMAKAAMRHELLWDDGPQLYQRAALHPCITASLDAIRAAVDTGASRAEIVQLVDRFYLPFFTYDKLARDAADSTDVWAHMPQEETEPFILAYALVPQLSQTSVHEAYDGALLRAFTRTGAPLFGAESGRLLEAVEALRSDDRIMWLGAQYGMMPLHQLGQLDPQRTRALMKDARDHYGACVKDLPPDFPASLPQGDTPEPGFRQH